MLERSKTNSFAVYKREQARISRHRLYPFTAFYTCYAVVMLAIGSRTAHPFVALAFYVAGIPSWTFIEYFTHRFVLHGRFKVSKHRWKFYKKWANKYLDPTHWEHHERPYDGLHISGELKDLLPMFAVFAPATFIFPTYTVPMMLAGIVQSYVIEEWVHHSVHFYNFRSPYFKYMKKHHFYHHTSPGMNRGFGLSSGIWDVILKSRFPETVRQRMYGNRKRAALTLDAAPDKSFERAAR